MGVWQCHSYVLLDLYVGIGVPALDIHMKGFFLYSEMLASQVDAVACII